MMVSYGFLYIDATLVLFFSHVCRVRLWQVLLGQSTWKAGSAPNLLYWYAEADICADEETYQKDLKGVSGLWSNWGFP